LKKPLLSGSAVLNLQAALVLVATLVVLVAVPHAALRPLSIAVAAASALAVIGLRASLRRMQEAVRLLSSNPESDPEELLGAVLRPAARRALRLGPQRSAGEAIARIRARQETLTSLGIVVALPGICAFLVALYFFAG
jgi:hypothetical protein